ncbi:hypothetical protein C8Q77DRAFT_1160380 [Trametes polyzona]|nr:hypothetical protein C8Q77DRAFT_1160380 [Trametes polyzona]
MLLAIGWDSPVVESRALSLETLLPHSHRLREVNIKGPHDILHKFYTMIISRLDILEKLRMVAERHYNNTERSCIVPDIALGGTGIKELMHAVSSHASKDPPAKVTINGIYRSKESLLLEINIWKCLSGSISFVEYRLQDALSAVTHPDTGTLFAQAKALKLEGRFGLGTDWPSLLRCFPNVRHLEVNSHVYPFRGLFRALATTSPDTNQPLLPAVSSLKLRAFRFVSSTRTGRPFDELLDWLIYRCNRGCPIDKVALNSSTNLTLGRIKRLREVVVDVCWDGHMGTDWNDWSDEDTASEDDIAADA